MKQNGAAEIVSAAEPDATMAGFVPQSTNPNEATQAGFVSGTPHADESGPAQADRSGSDLETGVDTETPTQRTPPEAHASENDPAIGTRIGDFLITSVIASGGMGTVYKADQQEPVRRTVALKMIRSGMADEATTKRFFVERQTLALMDHPDIARVYDAGTTACGNPYFAMEYCEGKPIDEYCCDRKLDVPMRIELVVRIARALQRAHAAGIVHRDLKPGNILVSDCEGRPNLKVIDFGIAKFTDTDQYDELFACGDNHETRVGELVGTPAYMSPEQAAGASIDARTDVFAIGAILYKLLTGTTPLPPPPKGCESLADVIQHIQSFVPVSPSRRLAAQAVEAEQHATGANCDRVSQLRASIKGDLDWVTLRAIDPDKLRRYATADDFADDLERFLNHQPVVAAAPSHLYRFKKFYQRRRPTVLATAIVSATLLLSLAYGGFSWWKTRSELLADFAQTTNEVTTLLCQADSARVRAGKGGPHSAQAFTEAQTSLAKAESRLASLDALALSDALQSELNSFHAQLKNADQTITADQSAMDLVKRLNDARERATQVDPAHGSDAFGKTAGLQMLVDAFASFGICPDQASPEQAARIILACPPAVQPKLIESLDFLVNEDPIGAGIYIHQQGGRVTVAEITNGSATDGVDLRAGDRIMAINGVDLLDSFTTNHLRAETYRLLSAAPGTTVTLSIVRDLGQPIQRELVCGGQRAHWAAKVLERVDRDPWRNQLRRATLTADLASLRKLSESKEVETQSPFSLIQLAGTLFLLERSNASIRFLKIAQQRHPANFWANHYLGTALAVAHDPPKPREALPYFTAAVSLRPKSVGARMNLVEGLVRVGEKETARLHASVAAKLAPDYAPLQQIVASLSNSAEGADAVSASEPAVASLPRRSTPTEALESDDIESLEGVARELAIVGLRDEAFKLIKQAAEQFPGDPRIRRMKGAVLIDLRDYVAARVALSDAARRMPNDAATRFYHGVALQYSGDSDAAIHEYEAALQIRPDYNAARRYLESLKPKRQD